MYQNCAYLKVVGTASSFTGPEMFVANTGQCTTTDGVEIAFPNAGNSVEYGGGYAGETNVPSTPDCANIASNNLEVTVSGAGGSSSSSNSNTTSTSTSSSTSPTSSTSSISTSTSTTTSSISSSTTSTTSSTTPSNVSGCSPSAIQCSSDGLSWSICVNNVFVSIGLVSSGTKCINGAIVCASNSNSGTTAATTGTKSTTQTTISATGCTSGVIQCA